jgi:hypothetical protein
MSSKGIARTRTKYDQNGCAARASAAIDLNQQQAVAA